MSKKAMNNTQISLIRETMKVVAEVGLEGLSTRKVTRRVGVSVAMIYQYFRTKEQLLYDCFMAFNCKIAELYRDFKVPELNTTEDVKKFLHDEWVRYFNLMLDSDYQALFYYAYRESNYFEAVRIEKNEQVAADMKNFSDTLNNVLSKVTAKKGLPTDYLWLYIIDGTGNFVKQIIKRKIPREEIDTEKIFQLIFGGISAFIGE